MPQKLNKSPEKLLYRAFHGGEIKDAEKVLSALTLLDSMSEHRIVGFEMIVPNNGYCIIEDVAEAFLDDAAAELGVTREELPEHCLTYEVRFRRKTPPVRSWKKLLRQFHQQEARFRSVRRPCNVSIELFKGFRDKLQACVVGR